VELLGRGFDAMPCISEVSSVEICRHWCYADMVGIMVIITYDGVYTLLLLLLPLLLEGVVKARHTAPSCRPLLSSISESTGVPGVLPGVPGVLAAAESGVWLRSSSTHVHNDIVPRSSEVKESTVALVNDAEVILIQSLTCL